MQRRTVLATGSAVIGAVLAGCSGQFGDGGSGDGTPTGTSDGGDGQQAESDDDGTAPGSSSDGTASGTGDLDSTPGGESDGSVSHTPAPESCPAASRPEPAAPDREEAVSPAHYPEFPETTSDKGAAETLTDEAAAEYAEEFERAYVRNERLEVRGDHLVDFYFGLREVEIEENDGERALVRLTYQWSTTTDHGDRQAIADSGRLAARYAITADGVFRTAAAARGPGPEDPTEAGTLVACPE